MNWNMAIAAGVVLVALFTLKRMSFEFRDRPTVHERQIPRNALRTRVAARQPVAPASSLNPSSIRLAKQARFERSA